MSPFHEVLKTEGARFGVVNGWERPLFFASEGFEEQPGFRFTNAHDLIGGEVATVQNSVGTAVVKGFMRLEITGDGALDWLDGMVCSRVPRRAGRIALVYALNPLGGIKAEATLAHLPENVLIASLTEIHTTLVVAGPGAREALDAVMPDTDWTYRWLFLQTIGDGIIAMAVSFSGEEAWELNIVLIPTNDVLRRAGAVPFRLYATESMRLEKGCRHWRADLITEFGIEAYDLSRLARPDKSLIGNGETPAGPAHDFVSMILNTDAFPAHPGDSILSDGRIVGTVTSAGWGHRTGRNIAMGFVTPNCENLAILTAHGEVAATLCEPCLYEPDNARLKPR